MLRNLRQFILTLVTCSILLSLLTSTSFADSRIVTDLSWPNCGEKNLNTTSLGIVGVNGGLDFKPNPCLNSETLLFHNQYSLYLNTGYPGVSYGLKFKNSPLNCSFTNLSCLAYNYGYNAALYSIRYADLQNVHSFVWWLDVETDNSWTNSYSQNINALIGMVHALKNNGLMATIGFYSYPAQWQLLTNNWKSGLPTWLASGSSSIGVAKSFCSMSLDGGPVWLSQYTTTLDYNYACSYKSIDNFKLR